MNIDFTYGVEILTETQQVRLAEALDMLNSAIDSKSIYNVDYKLMKENFGRAFQSIFHDLNARLRESSNDKELVDFLWFTFVDSIASAKSFHNKILKEKKMVIPENFKEFSEATMPIVLAVESLKEFVVKGRKPAVNPSPVKINPNKLSLTCPFCGREIAVDSLGNMVAHGYRHMFGAYVWNCLAVGQKAVELSVDGLKFTLNVYKNTLESLQKQLSTTKNLDVINKTDFYGKIVSSVKKGENTFDYLLEQKIHAIEFKIKRTKCSISNMEQRIQNWTPNKSALAEFTAKKG